MIVLHRCQFCDSGYSCDTTEAVSEDVYRCACKSVDTCPGCSEHGACEECGTKPAVGELCNPWLCADCYAVWLDNYDGPREPDCDPVSITELSERAAQERRDLRRRD